MPFPRIKSDFNFLIERTYEIPGIFAGRADLISNDIFGNFRFYKPLCEANNINLVYGMRVGIRNIEDAVRIEAKTKVFTDAEKQARIANGLDPNKYSDNEINGLVEEAFYVKVPGELDWNNYGDNFNGYVSDLYQGRLLLVPTTDSCIEWLRKFEKIDIK
jgi:hypothetical protein